MIHLFKENKLEMYRVELVSESEDGTRGYVTEGLESQITQKYGSSETHSGSIIYGGVSMERCFWKEAGIRKGGVGVANGRDIARIGTFNRVDKVCR